MIFAYDGLKRFVPPPSAVSGRLYDISQVHSAAKHTHFLIPPYVETRTIFTHDFETEGNGGGVLIKAELVGLISQT